MSRLTASLAFVGLKKPIALNLGSSNVASDMILMLCILRNFSLRSLMRCSPISLASEIVAFIASSWGICSTIFYNGTTFEPDILFSSNSSIVASWNGDRMDRQPITLLYSAEVSTGMSVSKLAKAAPRGSLSSTSHCSIWKVLFHRVSTSWSSFSFGLPICSWKSAGFSLKNK